MQGKYQVEPLRCGSERLRARAKGITNDVLPVIMSASDWASFMISCIVVHQEISAKSGANVASNTYGSLLTQENNFKLIYTEAMKGYCLENSESFHASGSGVFMPN